MGRHVNGVRRAVLLPVLVVVGVLVVAGVTFAARALTVGSDDGDPTAESSTSTSDDVTSSSAAPSATATAVVESEPPAELAACQDEIAAAEVAAEAAALSAAHWSTHTQAQELWQAGEYSLEEARTDWADTKALGPEDQERFAEAQAAYDAAFGGCDSLASAADVDPALAAAVADCVARGEALNAVVVWGSAVDDDWGEHLAFMTTRPEADEVDYLDEWEGQVSSAPENYQPYLDAVEVLEAAPVCSA